MPAIFSIIQKITLHCPVHSMHGIKWVHCSNVQFSMHTICSAADVTHRNHWPIWMYKNIENRKNYYIEMHRKKISPLPLCSPCYDGEHKIDFCSEKMLLMNSHFSSHFWHTKQQLRLRYTKLYFANAFPFPFRLTSICHCILSPFHALFLFRRRKNYFKFHFVINRSRKRPHK